MRRFILKSLCKVPPDETIHMKSLCLFLSSFSLLSKFISFMNMYSVGNPVKSLNVLHGVPILILSHLPMTLAKAFSSIETQMKFSSSFFCFSTVYSLCLVISYSSFRHGISSSTSINLFSPLMNRFTPITLDFFFSNILALYMLFPFFIICLMAVHRGNG